MNYEQFATWLHGFLEISNAETIDKHQTQIIRDHLALLFDKKTPTRVKEKITWDQHDPAIPQYPAYIDDPVPPGYNPYNPYKVTCETDTPLGHSVCSEEKECKFAANLHKDRTYC